MIRINLWNSTKILLAKTLGVFFGCTIFDKNLKKYLKLYEECETKLRDDLDIIQLIKFMKGTKILMKAELMDKETLFQIKHNHKNIINLDEDSPEEKTSLF